MSTSPWDLCATSAFNITPNDGANLTKEIVAISLNVGGTICCDFGNGTKNVTVGPLPAGLYPLNITKVYGTGTTATGLVGFVAKR